MNSTRELIVTGDSFQADVLDQSHRIPVLVDFWADWCGPCKQLMPILDRLSEEYSGRFVLAKVNTEEQQELAQQIGIRSLPTVALFKDGQVADHFVGVVPEQQIRELLDRHVPAPIAAPLSPLERARALKARQEFPAAKLLVVEALEAEPESLPLACELAELNLLSGDIAAAKKTLRTLEAKEPKAAPVKRLAAMLEFNDVIAAQPDSDALRAKLAANPDDVEARYALAVHHLLAGDSDAALKDWLGMLRTHRNYRDGLVRKSLLMAFELIGSNEPLVAQTRREMAQLLF